MSGSEHEPRWADDADPDATQAIPAPFDPDATQAIPPVPSSPPPAVPPGSSGAPTYPQPQWASDPGEDAPTTYQAPVPPAAGWDPGYPPTGPPPVDLPAAGDDGDGGNRQLVIALVAVGVVLLVVAAAIGVLIVTDDDGEQAVEASGEVLLEPAASNGPDPFTQSVGELFDAERVTGLSPSGRTDDTKADRDGDEAQVQQRVGTQPGLYGGTMDQGSCNPEQLVAFLEDEPAKAAAWASVQGIPSGEIAEFVDSLTPAILLEDTRVTNHGFANGAATPHQSVLQAGTAVMIDERGVPRVRCACGNPLLPPIAQAGTTQYTGDPWPGFDPGALGAVTPGEPTDVFILTDIDTGRPFTRPAGSAGDADAAITAATTTTTTSTTLAPVTTTTRPATTTTTLPTTTTTEDPPGPTTTTTVAPPTPIDITAQGTASASSEYSSDFPASFGIDGDPTTSWFSAGTQVDGAASTFTWSTDGQWVIKQVVIEGNGANADPANRIGYGFESVTVEVLSGDSVSYSETFGLPGTPDPTVTARPDAPGDTVRLTFTGHEAEDCGGFGELTITGVN